MKIDISNGEDNTITSVVFSDCSKFNDTEWASEVNLAPDGKNFIVRIPATNYYVGIRNSDVPAFMEALTLLGSKKEV